LDAKLPDPNRLPLAGQGVGRLFQEKAGGTSANGVGRQVRIVVRREHDDLAVEALGFQTSEQAPVDILWMDKVQPALLSQLFERPARQLLAEAIEIVE
jgi:hypothetical protein